MRWTVLLIALASCVAQADGAKQLFAKVEPFIVTVQSIDETGQVDAMGSGVIQAAERVVTNCHVVKDAAAITVRKNKIEYQASWLVGDEQKDLCILKVVKLAAPKIALRSFKTIEEGEGVYAVGNPLGFEMSLSEGVVSMVTPKGERAGIWMSAPISPGSSGGGLFDAQGRLVGITTAMRLGADNMNYAVPAEWIEAVVKHGHPPLVSAKLPPADIDWMAQAQSLQVKQAWSALLEHTRAWQKVYPSAAQALTHQGLALYNLGRQEEAERALRSALAEDAQLGTAWSYLALVLRKKGLRDAARQALDRAMQVRPEEAYAYGILSDWLREEGKHGEAAAAARQALTRRPSDGSFWLSLGHAQYWQKNYTDALQAYRRAQKLDPDNVIYREAVLALLLESGRIDQLKPVLERIRGSSAVEARAWLAVGDAEAKRSHFVEAEKAYRQAIEIDPKMGYAQLALAQAMGWQGRQQEVEPLLVEAQKYIPEYAPLYVAWGDLYARRQRLPEAVEYYAKATRLDRGAVNAWRALTATLNMQRKYSEALKVGMELVQFPAATGEDWLMHADNQLHLGMLYEAKASLDRAEVLQPNHPRLPAMLGEYYGRSGDNQHALEYLDRAIAADGSTAETWSSKGYALARLQRYAEAEEALETAIRLKPESANAWINLGETLVLEKKLGPAIAALERAVQLSPRATDAKIFLARAYYMSRQLDKSRFHLNATLALTPDYPAALAMLVIIDLIEGDHNAAKQAYGRLKIKDPRMAHNARMQAIQRGVPGVEILTE